jgi:hypothetical protein
VGVFKNAGGKIRSEPSSLSGTTDLISETLDFADVDHDGRPDLAVADWGGHLLLFKGQAAP